MAASGERHPILVDTSGLIAVANTGLWDDVCTGLRLTTTNVCVQELRRHVDANSEHARAGTRERRLHAGGREALQALEDEEIPCTAVTCVPRPHGADAGEESLRREVAQHTDTYRVVVVKDDAGRRSIRRTLDGTDASTQVVAPTYLFYLLYDADVIDREAFCEACGDLLENEGWTGYQAVKTAWERIPLDCRDVLDDELLPP